VSPEPVSRLVAVINEPIPVRDMPGLVSSLEAQYGAGLTISTGRWSLFEIRTPGRTCWCLTCEEDDVTTFVQTTGRFASVGMVVCPECGNKRCPRATLHDLDCSGSNEPGQAGSAYA
jgi:hypothetical protein